MCQIISLLPCLLLDVQNTERIRYTPFRGTYTTLDTQPYAISVNQCHKIESTLKNTNMFEGQLQLALSKTPSASTSLKRPETQF